MASITKQKPQKLLHITRTHTAPEELYIHVLAHETTREMLDAF